MIITDTLKITKAGQVTVPKTVRNILQSDTVAFEITDTNEIHLIAIPSVAGALNAFSKENKQDFSSIRESSWKKQTQRLTKKIHDE